MGKRARHLYRWCWWAFWVCISFLLLGGGLGFLDDGVRLWFGLRVGARPTLFLLAQKDIVQDFHVLAALVTGAFDPLTQPSPASFDKLRMSERGLLTTLVGRW